MRRLLKPDATGQPAPAGAPPADPPAADPPAPKPPEPPADPPAGDAGKTFTQAEIDKIAAKARKDGAATAKAEAAAAAAAAAMTAEEKLKADAKAADDRATEAISRANRVLVQAKAEVAAATAGATGDNVEAVTRLADLSGVDVDDDGTVDAESVKAAITLVKGKFPSLFGAAGTSRSGGDFQGGGDGKRVYTEAMIAAMSSEEFAKAQDDINAAMAEPGRPRLRSA
jgi:hypothetical protein